MARNPKPLRRRWSDWMRATGWRGRWKLHRRLHGRPYAAMLLHASLRGEPGWMAYERAHPPPRVRSEILPRRLDREIVATARWPDETPLDVRIGALSDEQIAALAAWIVDRALGAA